MSVFSSLARKIRVLGELVTIPAGMRRSVEVQRELLRMTILSDLKYHDPKRLNRYELRHFSQNGEDGIIAEIFHRIGTSTRIFAELGVGDGMENNSAYLLLQGWTGFWFEGGPSVADIRKNAARFIAANRLVVAEAFLTAENVAETLEKHGVPKELDLLSVDIDRNTSYAWAALSAWRPRAAIIEYNPSFAPTDSWEIEYQPSLTWDGTMYFGASLLRLEEIGRRMGYLLVGCDLAGVNAFFVREDLAGDLFCSPYAAQNHFEPARHYLTGTRSFSQGFGDCAVAPLPERPVKT